jgi:dihydroorotate dehydrogenase electron transfer subunit
VSGDYKNPSIYFSAKVINNLVLNKDFRLLILDKGDDSSIPQPGQFYMLQCGNTYDPLLKRPFSIFRFKENTIQFLYRIRGKGTFLLSCLKKGDIINIIGPLGKAFPAPEGDFIALAGGIGIASIMPLLEKFKKKAFLFYGAKSRDELIMLEDAKTFSKEIFISTDDGSTGNKGPVTDLLENSEILKNYSLPIYACGPNQMLKEFSRIVSDKEINCYVSLEEYMACGVGACLGCVVKIKDSLSKEKWSYKRVCKEGPVFDVREILWQ